MLKHMLKTETMFYTKPYPFQGETLISANNYKYNPLKGA